MKIGGNRAAKFAKLSCGYVVQLRHDELIGGGAGKRFEVFDASGREVFSVAVPSFEVLAEVVDFIEVVLPPDVTRRGERTSDLHRRYLNDPFFSNLVNANLSNVESGNVTLTDIIEAAAVAWVYHESRQMKRNIRHQMEKLERGGE